MDFINNIISSNSFNQFPEYLQSSFMRIQGISDELKKLDNDERELKNDLLQKNNKDAIILISIEVYDILLLHIKEKHVIRDIIRMKLEMDECNMIAQLEKIKKEKLKIKSEIETLLASFSHLLQ